MNIAALLQRVFRRFSAPPPAGASPPLSGGEVPGHFADLQQSIRYRFQNPAWLTQSLVHRSCIKKTGPDIISNERLEFLGDSVLNMVVAEFLFRRSPDLPEGELTKIRSRLVNRRALAAYARAIELSRYVLMSPSAAQSAGKGNETILADCLEALIAAIYLDGGLEPARTFVETQVLSAIDRGAVLTDDRNFKSLLLEYAQARGFGVPRYTIVREEGPDHDRTFTVEVTLGSGVRGSGSGKSKKEAEQSAAASVYGRMQEYQNASS